MNEEKNFKPNSGDDGEEEFQKFLDLIKSGSFIEDPSFDVGEGEEDIYPDLLEDDPNLIDGGEELCPAISAITDMIKESVESIGVFGIRWTEEDMIDVLKVLGYKPDVFTIDVDFPDDLNKEERELMEVIIPDNKVEVKIVKKGRKTITKDNFRDFRPKAVFEKEVSKFGKNLLIKLLTDYGKGEAGA